MYVFSKCLSVSFTFLGIIIVGAGLALFTAFFFPIFGYKVCYALGGCQNTLDNYVDRMIGVQGRSRKITKRDVNQKRDMDYVMDFLKMAMRQYEDKAINERDERVSFIY